MKAIYLVQNRLSLPLLENKVRTKRSKSKEKIENVN
jgi:hypothetical protein